MLTDLVMLVCQSIALIWTELSQLLEEFPLNMVRYSWFPEDESSGSDNSLAFSLAPP